MPIDPLSLSGLLGLIEYPNFDPVAIEIGPFQIRWYGIAYVAGLFVGVWLMRRIAASRAYRYTADDASDFMLWTLVGIMAGGRLGSVFFYNFDKFRADPIKIFYVWEGGMAFHGGVLGVVLALLLFTRRRKIPLLAFGDAAVCCIPPGLFFGRLANFVNGELWGRPTDASWAMVFPADPTRLPRHPSQLYEAALEGVALFVLLWVAKATIAKRLAYGILGGLFLLGYAVARTVVEQFREPDAHIGFLWGGFTMGQLLSAPMVLVGTWLIVRAWRLRGVADGPAKALAEARARDAAGDSVRAAA